LRRWFALALASVLFSGGTLFAQNKPEDFVGMTVDTVIKVFGTPRAVYAVRGKEVWQDDVVFVYADTDLYLYKDRVWQASVKETKNIKIGDSEAAVLQQLGEPVERAKDGTFSVYKMPATVWPYFLRFNFDAKKRVTAILYYRGDD
jgi:hypothetical protein